MRLPVLLCCLCIAHSALAQYKVDEIMAKGGHVMTADEIRREIIGHKFSGRSEQFEFELELHPDGNLEGMNYAPQGATRVIGTWTVSAKNQLCSDLVYLRGGHNRHRCIWLWKAQGEYYATNSRTDDQAAENFVECIMSGGKECVGGFSLAKRTVRK